jgi:hypothetical protein
MQRIGKTNKNFLKFLRSEVAKAGRCTRSSKRDSNYRNLALQVVAVALDLPELY